MLFYCYQHRHWSVNNLLGKKQQRAFTLLELLVVIIIVAVLAGVVTYKGMDRRESVLSDELERLRNVLNLMRQRVRIIRQPKGLLVYEKGYQMVDWDYAGRRWRLATGQTEVNWPLPKVLTLLVDRPVVGVHQLEPENRQPDVIIYPDGAFTPFLFTLMTDDGALRGTLSGNGYGDIDLERP